MKQNETIHWRVDFEGVLDQPVRSSLIEELFKFIIFERRQIPTAFDLLKRAEHAESLETGKKKLHDRKLESCIEGVDLILSCIRQAFTRTDRIHQALVIIGPTIVSPKEVYLLKLPEGDYEGEHLLRRKCVQTMIRRLITKDIFKSCKELNTTNIHVLLRCPSDLKLENLQPKLNFEIPKRGQRFELEIGCTCEKLESEASPEFEDSLDETHPLMKLLADCDISGVGLLETTLENPTSDCPSDPPTYEAANGQENEVACTSTDMIWYRVNTNLKGCRGKAAECSGIGWC